MSDAQEVDARYVWTPKSGTTIADFLRRTRPSLITADDTPWIWVSSSTKNEDPEKGAGQAEALMEAKRLLDDLERRLKRIEDDDAIPVRAKKGVQSKKAVRDETYAEVTKDLKELSERSKWTGGKWLLFPSHESVDGIWTTLAKSVAEGPLSKAGVDLAKVAPTSSESSDDEHKPHLICLYISNVYDIQLVREVLTTLLTQHGIEPSSVKSDLYTLAGIDSSHPTKLRSSIWRPHEVIEGGGEAIKKLKAQYKPSRKATDQEGEKKPLGPRLLDEDSEDERTAQAIKRKAVSVVEPEPKREEKQPRNVSDGAAKGDDDEDAGRSKAVPVKRVKSAAATYKENDIFADPGDDSD